MPGSRSTSGDGTGLSTLCAGGLLACLILPYAACAKPASNDRSHLIIDSFANGPARPSDSEAAQSRVQPVADIALGAAVTRDVGPGSPVAAMMQAQFAAAGRSHAPRTSFRNVLARAGGAAPQPPLRQMLAAPDAAAAQSTCQAYPYRATNILKPDNEAYRRLLLPYVVHEACAAGIPASVCSPTSTSPMRSFTISPPSSSSMLMRSPTMASARKHVTIMPTLRHGIWGYTLFGEGIYRSRSISPQELRSGPIGANLLSAH